MLVVALLGSPQRPIDASNANLQPRRNLFDAHAAITQELDRGAEGRRHGTRTTDLDPLRSGSFLPCHDALSYQLAFVFTEGREDAENHAT